MRPMKSSSRFERFVPAALALLLAPTLAAASRAQGLAVDAGPDRFLLPPATSLELSASVRGLRVSQVPSNTAIVWTQSSGPRAVILDDDTLTPTVIPSRAGRLRLRLEVIDPEAGVVTDDVTVYAFGASQDAALAGEARTWHKLTLTFTHDSVLSESGPVNPFLDLRLVTHFYNLETGALLAVPGFFAADGNAAETGADAGDRWCTNFTPEHAGTWYYAASFRAGPGIAVLANSEAGRPASFDGATGFFTVETADPGAPGFLSKGRLQYVGGHHLRFAETHEYFLKNGAGSPENLFGYYEFDGTFDQGGRTNDLNTGGARDGLHHFDPHLGDYVDLGAPLWHGQKGQRLFGALSYLASRGVNSLYTVTYNVDGGDGQEVWPWSSAGDKLRFDVSKLAQWERVLDHMSRAGIAWHVVTQETENDHVLDDGALGIERRLYYRELVARFAHAPGLVWNLGEENTNSTKERKAFADYLHALDPYDHPVTIHNVVGDLFGLLNPLLGTHLELVSIQGDPVRTPPRALQVVRNSAAAGRPWVVNFDEQTPASDGVVPDAEDFWHDLIRRESLWPMLMVGGGGCEWYFGYAHPHSDLDCEDFRSRDNLWTLSARALDFLRAHVPFTEMESADLLAIDVDAGVLAKPGEFYVVYLPFGGAVSLDLEGYVGPFLVSWFDARNGGPLQDGTVTEVSSPGPVSLGAAPDAGDWVAFVRRAENFAPEIESIHVEPAPFAGDQDFALRVHALDPNGPMDVLSVRAEFRAPSGVPVVTLPLRHRGGSLYSFFKRDARRVVAGTWQVVVTVTDSSGASATGVASFETL